MSQPDHSLFIAGLDAPTSFNEHCWFMDDSHDRHAKMAVQEVMHTIVHQEITSKDQCPTSKNGFRKNRPAPLFTQPLPRIPTVSSPFFPNGLDPSYPDFDQPDLSWGTTITSPSYPSFLASSTAASVHNQQVEVWSPISDLPTADILAVYDELTQTPPPAPENRNHPYVPWSPSFRAMFVSRSDDQSPQSPTTHITHISRSSPVSRSGAAAPEPPESPDVPRCGYAPRQWCRFISHPRRPQTSGGLRFLRRLLKKRRMEHENEAAFTLVSALQQTSRVLTLGTGLAPATTAPAETRPESPIYVLAASPIAPSFTTVATDSLGQWLEMRRLSTTSSASGAVMAIHLEEYERRGSWIDSLHEDTTGKSTSDAMVDALEKARRHNAVRHGWICGFMDCDMHPQDHSVHLHDNHDDVLFGIAH